MTIQEMVERKQKSGYTCERIAKLSGVPLGTVQKMFLGKKTDFEYDTLLALEHFFLRMEESDVLKEEAAYITHKNGEYTVEDYRCLPDDLRVELIDGGFYVMQAPTVLHQRIVGEIYRQIANFIMDRGGRVPVYDIAGGCAA